MHTRIAACILSILSFAAVASADTRAPSTPYKWRNVQIVGGGFVDGLVFNPARKGLLYARTDIGGCYRWDSKAKRWWPMTDWIDDKDGNLYGGESIGIDSSNPSRLYLAAGMYDQDWASTAEILRSDDGGRTFKRSKLPIKMGGNENGRSAGERLAVDPNKDSIVYFGSRDDGLWRSRDYGATWSKVDSYPIPSRTNGVATVFVVFDKSTGKRGQATPTIYVGQSAKTLDVSKQPYDGPTRLIPIALYRSTNAGVTWSPVPSQPVGLLPHQAQLASDGSLYVTYTDAPGPNEVSDGAVWKYNTKTSIWTNVTPVRPNVGGSPGFGYAGLTIDAQHPQTVMVTTLDKWHGGDDLFRTTNGGKTWKGLATKAILNDSLSPFLNWGGKPKFGWWMGAVAVDPYDSNHVLFGTGATIWASENVTASDVSAATHWFVGAKGLEETAITALVSPPAGPHLISGMGDIGGFRHDNLDVSPPEGMSSNPIFGTTKSIDFAEKRPALVVRVGNASGGAHQGAYSIDLGRTWSPFPTLPATKSREGNVAVSADGSTIVWAPWNGKVSYTRDRGATWAASVGIRANVDLVSDRVNPARFYGFDEKAGMLYISSDGGASFWTQSTGLRGRMVVAPERQGDLWVVGDDSLGVWHAEHAGAPFVRVPAIDEGYGLGFGKAAPGHKNPALYLAGMIAGQTGVFRSDDAGAHWVRITDDQHQFGWIGWPIAGDPRIYGRVYVGTNGRGTLYADPAP